MDFKGYANFQLTTPVHKKRVLIRRIEWQWPHIVKHWEFCVIWTLMYLSTILYSENYWREVSIVFNLGINTTLSRKLLTSNPDTKIGQNIVINSGQRSRYVIKKLRFYFHLLLLSPYVVPCMRALFEHDFWKGKGGLLPIPGEFQSTNALAASYKRRFSRWLHWLGRQWTSRHLALLLSWWREFCCSRHTTVSKSIDFFLRDLLLVFFCTWSTCRITVWEISRLFFFVREDLRDKRSLACFFLYNTWSTT